jgi:hypothetical protein
MWLSRMQKKRALSMAEAECCSALSAGSDVLYLCKLLEQLGFAQASPTPVFKDKLRVSTTIEWANNMIGGREGAKHIDIRQNFAHEVIRTVEMPVICVTTASQCSRICSRRACSTSSGRLASRSDQLKEPVTRITSRVTSPLKRVVST